MLRKIITIMGCLSMCTGFALAASPKARIWPVATASHNMLILKLKDGDVSIKLRPDLALNHVARIKQLVADGAYNNVTFHRVIEGFMAQTGDVKYGQKGSANFNADLVGTGGSKYGDLAAEFSKEPFVRGVLGMARAGSPDSANSQFFICLKDALFLNNQYTVIGNVVKGMEAVDKIKKGDSAKNGAVKDADIIIKASIE